MSPNSTSEPSDIQRGDGDETPAEDERIGAWQSEIDRARRRERDFRTEGRWLTEVYEGTHKESVPFNILYSNTETLSPALYNNTPRPVVKPRYKTGSPMPKAAGDLTTAFLEFFIDTGDADATQFDDLILAAVHEALVPGRGLTRFDYDSDIELDEAKKPKKVNREYICGKHIAFDRFCHGYAKRWADVPWICFTHYLSKEEADLRWPDKKAELVYDNKSSDAEDLERLESTEGVGLAIINEVWSRHKRKVYFFAEGGKQFLEEKDDEYKLTGFYNIPRPMTFVTKISGQTPKALYTLYETQARELNSITNRIRVVIAAIKAVGFYNPMIQGLDKVLELEDGKMHPMEGAAALGEVALQNAVWMWPAEKLVVVLQTLMQQRDAIKNVIYEITGLSDILRGASVASETATAQSLKNQWGSLRIKRFQKEVARYVKDCLRIAAELGFTKLDADTIRKATASTLPSKVEHDAAKARLGAAKQEALSLQAQNAPPQMPGQPPAPPPPLPPPNPQDIDIVSKVAFEDVLDNLKDDLNRKYLVEIELNSTVDVEATEDKTNLTDFLGAMAQFFGGIGPLVESGTLPWEAAKAMLLTISRKFRLGRDLDDELASMKQPEPKKDDGELKALQQAQAKVQQGTQALEKAKAEFAMQQREAQMKQRMDQMALKFQGAQQDAALQMKQAIAQVKDTKMKGMLEKILDDIEREREIAVRDVEDAKQDLVRESEHREMALEGAEMRAEHGVEKRALQLDSKTAKLKVQQQAAKAKPSSKA